MEQLTFTKLAEAAGISRSYAFEILNAKRVPSIPLAIHIYRTTAWKHPRIAELQEADIDTLERLDPRKKAA